MAYQFVSNLAGCISKRAIITLDNIKRLLWLMWILVIITNITRGRGEPNCHANLSISIALKSRCSVIHCTPRNKYIVCT